MSRPSLRQLEYAVAVADELHFRRAAERVAVTQPALSQQIKLLEEQLGVRLFERDARKVLMTPAGEDLVRRARLILGEVDQLCDNAAAAGEPLSGSLRMGVIPTVAPYLLPRVLPEVRTSYPRLRLLLHEDQTGRLIDMLVEGKLDVLLLALGVRGTEAEGLTALRIFDEPFWLATPIDHPLARRETVCESDLLDQDVLLLEDGHCLREQALAVCRTGGARESADVRATSLPTLAQMVASGMGITLLPECAVPHETERGGALAVRRFDAPAPSRAIGLLYRASSGRDREFRLLRDSIRGALG
ncbi:MAG TPA: LysR substrate-binding domain-containing protein [Kofleriaceae bacterium]|nr:LysR substrate-binding domain-containing protein [Kofleriaceae bacterium]